MLDVSVIIVNYNTKDLTYNCLKSVFEMTKNISFEVIVSDNGSTDGSIEMIKTDFPSVILIENNSNLGFGAANNRGLEIAKGKYIFYLNSDTLLLNNAIKMFFDYWESSADKDGIGALGGILLNEYGNTIHSGGDLPSYDDILRYQKAIYFVHRRNSLLKKLHMNWFYQLCSKFRAKNDIENVQEGEIGYITGADLFLLNNENARFDENYFLYYEETDLEFKLFEKNLKRLLINGPKIVHLTRKNNKDFNITSFSTIHCQISSIIYTSKNLKKDTSELMEVIKSDWELPYVNEIIEKIGKEKLIDLLDKANKVR